MSVAKGIDLRSDTVTKPDIKMKEAMFSAPLGDDVFDEDPTTRELEEFAAVLAGKESALIGERDYYTLISRF